MTTITSTSTGISQRTNVYAAQKMLEHAAPTLILDKFAKSVRMPKNKSVNITFRRPIPFDAATAPLTEGVTPTARALQFENVPATIKQYGEVGIITDVIEDTHEDAVLNELSEQLGENIGRTVESLLWAELRAGTNVLYANGTSRNAVNTPISLAKQRKAVRALKAQKAMKITKVLAPGPDYNTRAVEAAYVAVAHTDLENDIRNMNGFTPVAEYGSMSPICPEEIGACEDCRYVLSADLSPFTDDGGSYNGSGTAMVSTTGTSADVYPVIYLGKDAYAHIALRGAYAVEPSIIPVGQKTKDDPLAQRGYAGWKTWFVAKILHDGWMLRLETAATEL